MNRRSMLANIGLGAAAIALAGCTTMTVGDTTTITLNVAKVTAYATAGLNAAQTVETALAPFPALTAYVAPIQATTALLQNAVAAFSAGVGNSVTVSYSDSSVRSLVDSVLAAIEQISGLIGNVVAAMIASGLKITDSTVNHVQVVQDAITTIVSVFRALLTASPAPAVAMSEGRALVTLNA